MARMAAIILIFLALAGTAQAQCAEDQALKAAEAWLVFVDAHQYDASWDETSSYFKGIIAKPEWNKTLSGVRTPMGGMLSRNVESKTYATKLPGAPDGQYVVIEFTTSFTNKKEAKETVTPMLDSDGVWRVSGYYIQ